jgi:hypothetical protein
MSDAKVSIMKTFPVFIILGVCTIAPIFSVLIGAVLETIHYGNINGVYIISTTAIILLSDIKSHDRFSICWNGSKMLADSIDIANDGLPTSNFKRQPLKSSLSTRYACIEQRDCFKRHKIFGRMVLELFVCLIS